MMYYLGTRPGAGALHRSIGGGFVTVAACVKLQAGRKASADSAAGRAKVSETGRSKLPDKFEVAVLASQASCNEAMAAGAVRS